MIWLLLLIPALAALVAYVLPFHGLRRGLLVLAALAHTALTASLWTWTEQPILFGWIAVDAASLLFLSITSVLFLLASLYAVGYLHQQANDQHDQSRGMSAGKDDATRLPEATFTCCLLLFLTTMTLVITSRHLGLLWVAIEATTLASAPLICFHRSSRSLEATWKYLLICSVGIALALLGNFFLAVAAHHASPHLRLTIDELSARATAMNPMWLKAAFLLLLVGYGTKMGLAPLHTWLPDAHSEAPSVISAILSGALLNCALLGLLRVHGVLAAAGLAEFSRQLFVVFGLLSLTVAAVFIVGQADYKRMLAYSSVEHMGILALGVGIGGLAGFGSMLHAVNTRWPRECSSSWPAIFWPSTVPSPPPTRVDCSGYCHSAACFGSPDSWLSAAHRRSARSSARSPSCRARSTRDIPSWRPPIWRRWPLFSSAWRRSPFAWRTGGPSSDIRRIPAPPMPPGPPISRRNRRRRARRRSGRSRRLLFWGSAPWCWASIFRRA